MSFSQDINTSLQIPHKLLKYTQCLCLTYLIPLKSEVISRSIANYINKNKSKYYFNFKTITVKFSKLHVEINLQYIIQTTCCVLFVVKIFCVLLGSKLRYCYNIFSITVIIKPLLCIRMYMKCTLPVRQSTKMFTCRKPVLFITGRYPSKYRYKQIGQGL